MKLGNGKELAEGTGNKVLDSYLFIIYQVRILVKFTKEPHFALKWFYFFFLKLKVVFLKSIFYFLPINRPVYKARVCKTDFKLENRNYKNKNLKKIFSRFLYIFLLHNLCMAGLPSTCYSIIIQ